MVRIKVRAINELDDDVPNQDPEIVELEKEIENELAEAGVISKSMLLGIYWRTSFIDKHASEMWKRYIYV